MLATENIIRIALRESDGPAPDAAEYTKAVKTALEKPDQIPIFSSKSRTFDVVRFRCLLQDTGYPAEVYLPEDRETEDQQVDWSKLQERWVGWAVEIPGAQTWTNAAGPSSSKVDAVSDALASLTISDLPSPPRGKYPLTKEDYTGALLKVYDPESSYRPSSAYDVIGIVSTAPLPTSLVDAPDEGGDVDIIPCIHVLLPPTPSFPPAVVPTDVPEVRSSLVSHLATAFSPPDAVAAELLLLAFIAAPASRKGGVPLGTLSLNIIRPACESDFIPMIENLMPAVVPLSITIPLLHSTVFSPASDGSTLTPGLLQLAPGTLLVIDEDGLGDGGTLQEKAVRNLQALSNALADQNVRYMYPYTDGVRIECVIRSVITSEGKSLLPADLHVPTTLASVGPIPASVPAEQLAKFRAYLSSMSAPAHAEKLVVPESVAEAIQDAFVAERKALGSGSAEVAEARLRRRMKIARLMATSYPAAELTRELWERTVGLDEEVERRMALREQKRRETKLGKPTEDMAPEGEIEAQKGETPRVEANGTKAEEKVAAKDEPTEKEATAA